MFQHKRTLSAACGIFLCVVVFTFFTFSTALAGDPVGTAFTYQGSLKNSNAAYTGTCALAFSLYDALSGGAQVDSTQTLSGVAVAAGLFTVSLDFGTDVFTGEERFLEIAVKCGADAAFTTLAPRQHLTAVPYALYALNAPSSTGWSLTGNGGTSADTNFVGTTDDVPFVARVNDVVGWRLSPSGSNTPNVVGGHVDNSVRDGVWGAAIGGGGDSGEGNLVTDAFGTVAGGTHNQAGDDAGDTGDAAFATVGGGSANTASSDYATVGGGSTNTASSDYATVGGGQQNTANADNSTVGGGVTNTASATSATVGGGTENTASEPSTTIGGGVSNSAGGEGATVGGGYDNSTLSSYSTVAGGRHNRAESLGATVGGGDTNAVTSDFGTIAGGYTNTVSSEYAVVGGGNANTASANNTTVGGGTGNTASFENATVSGGTGNTAEGAASSVGGGDSNVAAELWTTVSGGVNNTTGGEAATVGGGNANTASADNTTVGGGVNNTASGNTSTVVGGTDNVASGNGATVGGGSHNEAAGDFSFVAGHNAKNDADHDGSFVFADSTGADFGSSTANEFTARASGGVRFYSNEAATIGVSLEPNTSAWAVMSDRAAKQNFVTVDAKDILNKVANMPILKWSYIADDTNIPHMGPMAQDFHSAFGLGTSDKTISTLDSDGVTFAAIQGLNELVEEKEARIATLEAQNQSLDARLTALEQQGRAYPLQGTLMFVPLCVAALGVGVWVGTRRGGK